MTGAPLVLSRRNVLQGCGALIVAYSSMGRPFAQEGGSPQAPSGPPRPGSLQKTPFLDSWIKVGADNNVTVLTGKAELGQGIRTALLQVAAEELCVSLASLTLITADTSLTANEEYTSGSHSMQDSGTAIRHAAAQTREILVGEAAKRWDVEPDQVRAENGAAIAKDGRRVAYGELVSDQLLHVEAQPQSRLRSPSEFTVMGKPVRRVDIPAKVTGGAAYVQDMRLPGMLHARVAPPPSYKARLLNVDIAAVERMPGVVKVIRDGNFLAVAAEREFQAIKAMRALSASAQWEETSKLPAQDRLPEMLRQMRSEDTTILDRNAANPEPVKAVEATYSKPYHMHGSIGPSCAVAQFSDGGLTVWTHTQGVYPDRKAIAQLLALPDDQVRCIHVEGAGCYGHNGADDAAGDAALVARAVQPRPVRLQWMREQENSWEPFGPAMLVDLKAGLDPSGKIANWSHEVWSNTHTTRPGTAGSLLAGRHVAQAFAPPAPKPIPQPEGGGDRNAIPLYSFPSARVVHHFLPEMPVRVSAARGLGAYMNVFAIESFMDELAVEAGADPVAFRLGHLDNPRAKAVIEATATRFGWKGRSRGGDGHGFGFAFAQYKNLAAYCAVAVELTVDLESGRVQLMRIAGTAEAGQAVNPDGIKNQIEGGIIQSASWTLFEAVTFDGQRITSVDWAAYPILRFDALPRELDVQVIDRPGQPFLGAGEASQGPASAAIANAVAHATGRRLRELPLSPDRIARSLLT
jgi:nicotinate dehydrogenase subunit B